MRHEGRVRRSRPSQKGLAPLGKEEAQGLERDIAEARQQLNAQAAELQQLAATLKAAKNTKVPHSESARPRVSAASHVSPPTS